MAVSLQRDRVCFSINDPDNDERTQVCLSRKDAGRLMLEMQRYFHNESETEDHLARVLGMAYNQASGMAGSLPRRTPAYVAKCEQALRTALFGPHR
jgi:hypothetical protein